MRRFLAQEPASFLFGQLWRFSGEHTQRVTIYVILCAIGTAIWTAQPALIGHLLNTIQHSGGLTHENSTYVMLLVSGLLGVDLVAWFFHGNSRILEQEHAYSVQQEYRRFLIQGVFNLPIAWHSERETGSVIDKINKATEALYTFSRQTFNVIQFVTRIIVTGAILAWFHWVIAVVVGILIIVSFIITHQFDAKIVRLLGEIHRKENTVVARITDAFTNIFSVKILHIEKPLERGIMEASGAVKQTQFTFIRVQEWKWFCGAVIFTIINLIPLFVYLSLVNAGYETFEIGTFTALYLYSGNLIYVYYGFNSTFEEMIQQRTKILNAKDIEDAILKNARVRRKQVPKQWKRITFGDVQFGYQEGRMQVDGVTLTVRKGESVALIGASGSGKTTILKVIHGMYDQARGTYATDDHAPQATTFANIDLSSTLVPQEPEVFSSTIRENITLGMGYSDKEVRVATDMARFTDVIASLPNGLASVVNEKGVNLSGGQKQRLALARALLFGKDKQILLLDESTSSVDSENEGYIYEAIRKEFSNRVIIASIHKLNLLKYFDRVIMFDAGKIVDDGSFDELYARNGYFKEQWDEYLKTT